MPDRCLDDLARRIELDLVTAGVQQVATAGELAEIDDPRRAAAVVDDFDVAGGELEYIDADEGDELGIELESCELLFRAIGCGHHHETEVRVLDDQTNRILIAIVCAIDHSIAVAVDEVGPVTDEHVDIAATEGVDLGLACRAVVQSHLQALRLGEREVAGDVNEVGDLQQSIFDRDPQEPRLVVEVDELTAADVDGMLAAGKLAEVDGRLRRRVSAVLAAVDLNAIPARVEREGVAPATDAEADQTDAGR